MPSRKQSPPVVPRAPDWLAMLTGAYLVGVWFYYLLNLVANVFGRLR